MLVSHDRHLLREVCDEFWLVAAARVKPFDGDLDDYQRWLLEQSSAAARAARPQPAAAPAAEETAPRPSRSRPATPRPALTARQRPPRASSAPTPPSR